MLQTMNYPGGKNAPGVYQRIVNLIPPHDVYVEPFLGSGAVMRLKRPARVNIGLDLELAALDLAMPPGGRRTPELAIAAETAGNGEGAGVLASNGGARGRRPLDLTMEDSGTGAPVPAMADPLVAPFASSGEDRSILASRAGNGDGRSPIFQLQQGDGIEFLARYPFRGDGRELVYCDPPYMMLSERSGKAIYAHELSAERHLELLRLIRRLPCLVLISGYWSALYAQELREWDHITFEGHTRKGTKTEWLWFNFPPPVELHDYRYLGRGFRERERIKRKTARWTARLKRMPVLERQALLSAIASIAGTDARIR